MDDQLPKNDNQQASAPVEQTSAAPLQTQPTATPGNSPVVGAKKGYGKKPMWFWVLLYVIVAAVVYFLIYLIFFHHSSTTGSLY